MRPTTYIKKAVKSFGSEKALAIKIGCSQTQVHKVKRGAKITADFAVAFEKATGVNRGFLRPDLWPKPATEKVS